MLTKKLAVQDELIFQTLDELVPQEHLVRRLDEVDYTFIHDIVKDLYSDDGRPSVDPIVLFKILTIKYVFHIKSLRQTLKDIEVNLAYRWFIKYPLSQKVPHYTVISYNFNKRFHKKKIGEQIFQKIFQQIFDLNILNTKEIDLSQLNLKVYQNNRDQARVAIKDEALYETTLV
jgi:transposase